MNVDVKILNEMLENQIQQPNSTIKNIIQSNIKIQGNPYKNSIGIFDK